MNQPQISMHAASILLVVLPPPHAPASLIIQPPRHRLTPLRAHFQDPSPCHPTARTTITLQAYPYPYPYFRTHGYPILRRGVLLDEAPDLLLVGLLVLFEEVEGVGLRGGLGVWLVEERLDTQEDFFNVYRGLPAFFFVEDGEADGAGGVDVGVEERGCEFAW